MAGKKVIEATTIADPVHEAVPAAPAPAATVSAPAAETMAAMPVKAEKTFTAIAAKMNDGMAGAVAGFEKTHTEAKATMEKAMKTAEEFVTFGQGNVEAVLKSGQIWAAGVQDLGKHFAATAQAQFDHTVTTFKAMTGVKSLKEAMDLQSTLARASMEKAVAETTKLTDASLKLAEQTLAPLTARMTLAVEKFGRAV